MNLLSKSRAEKKERATLQSQFAKEKAILSQRIGHLEMIIDDLESRERGWKEKYLLLTEFIEFLVDSHGDGKNLLSSSLNHDETTESKLGSVLESY